MEKSLCPYEVKRKVNSKTIIIHCRQCTIGNSTFSDGVCRLNLLRVLQEEQGVDRLILNHALVKVYSGEALDILIELTRFIDSIIPYATVKILCGKQNSCTECKEKKHSDIQSVILLSQGDPLTAYIQLKKILQRKQKQEAQCATCEDSYKNLIQEMLDKGTQLERLLRENETAEMIYSTNIRPYVRPGFIDSYLQLEPPPDAIFLDSYDVSRQGCRPIHVSLYFLRTRSEKLYFVVPSEYDLSSEELYLLEDIRLYLSNHRPKDTSFIDATTAEEYFQRLVKQILAQFVDERNLNIHVNRIEYLADIFSRYSAGFGILEDLLLDHHIQDIYVNAPVANNPLHLICDGEEYSSNIYLSDADVDALASRFRSISGRAFSEASPVLDMDLQGYHTRVTAISNPLTPRGIAFALRRHRSKPWTLTQFIANHMISPAAAGFLSFLVDGQASLLIAGSRGAGKTSLLSALLLEIPQRFRILTIEDTAEIPVNDLQRYGYKIQSLITKSISSTTQSTEIDPANALHTALRLGESVLILGEVRSVEAKVLFEAMRIGAAGNLIMGTIHGSTTRDVYERVVYDIGVPATSFKAVDAVVITAPIRSEGGIERKRRVVQISEIVKTGWDTTPDSEKIFQDIMRFDTTKDRLIGTDLLDMGQSQILETIAQKWGITVEKALQNIQLRTEIKKTIVEQSKNNKELLEAVATRDANNAFWMSVEESKHSTGQVDYKEVRKQWMNWFKTYVRKFL